LGSDEESLTSREKPTEEEIKVDKTLDRETQSTKEKDYAIFMQRENKVGVR
jgi:hypothetical protein